MGKKTADQKTVLRIVPRNCFLADNFFSSRIKYVNNVKGWTPTTCHTISEKNVTYFPGQCFRISGFCHGRTAYRRQLLYDCGSS